LESVWAFISGYWLLLLVGVALVHAVLLGLAVLSERREPSATWAWLLAVIFVPIIGVAAYYTVARTRFRRQYRARAAVNEQADEALSMYVQQSLEGFDDSQLQHLKPAQRGLIELAANSAQFSRGAPVFAGNAVELYSFPAPKYEALLEAIRSAQSHVHLEYFIYRGDRTGTAIRDLLVERARAGVEVRVLLDGVGTFRTFPADFWKPLAEAGGRAEVFLSVRFGKMAERVNFRNHRKIAVIDGRVGFVGGMNIGDEHVDVTPRYGRWRDSHVRIEGPAVAELQRIFLTDWLFTAEQTLAEPRFFPDVPATGTDLVQIVSSGPDCRWPTIQQLYFQAVTTATKQVLISTPYFIPDPSMLSALETAALRGIDVRVLVPARNDQILVTSAARSYYEELLETGVRVFEYRPGFMHAKTIAVDGRYGSVGSANMDVRSFMLNFEASAFVHSEAFGRRLQQQFEQDMAQSREVELETFRQRPRVERFRESVAQLFSGVL